MSQFIPMANPLIDENEARAVYDQVLSGWVSMGKRVKQFEAEVADYLGVKHAVAFNSGTATLHACLVALGVGKDDEVIVPSLSYISSANAVLYCGARPVFVEEDERTFTAEAEEIEELITEKTRAIMAVDLKGMPVDYEGIMEVSRKHDIPVLADSAESFGARYRAELVGKQAPVHSFSLFANKNVTTGEGGLVTTDDDTIDEICRCVRNQGQSERYVHTMIGHNYRMTDVTAALGIEQLKRLEYIMERKQEIAEFYNRGFSDQQLIRTPHVPAYVGRHTWYMYCLTLDQRVDRDKVILAMSSEGVDHRLSFPLIPLQPIYRKLFGYKEGDFPRAEKIFRSFLDIPCWCGMGRPTMQRVVDVVRKAVDQCITT